MTQVLLCLLLSLVVFEVGDALDNGLALTPPMGWMHWERFRCITDCKTDPKNCLSENLIMRQADRMAEDGYRDAGYVYLSIDDCWMAKERDSKGRLQADPIRFPRGIKFLADYLHNKGLKLGIYEDFGTRTCMGYPGSEFYLQLDAQTFASWKVDLLKLDGCNADRTDMKYGYEAMGFFLNKTGHPILYLCSWAAYVSPYKDLTDYPAFKKYCNQWRNYRDIQDSWDVMYDIIDYYGNNTYNLSAYAGSGHWNDPDELIIGGYGLSFNQEKLHMGMWAMMASPLFMSVDLETIRPSSKGLLLNKMLLEINQDPLGVQGQRIWKFRKFEIWQRPLHKAHSYAIAVINSDNEGVPRTIKLSLSEFGVTGSPAFNVTDVFDGTSHGVAHVNDSFIYEVNPTGIYMVRLDPVMSWKR